MFHSKFMEGIAAPVDGLVNFFFRGTDTPGMDSFFFKSVRVSGDFAYPKWDLTTGGPELRFV
jgi:hypothetical protein